VGDEMKINIQLRADDFAGIQQASTAVNNIIQAANSIGQLSSVNTGPIGVGYTIDMSATIQEQINVLQDKITALKTQLPPVVIVVASVTPVIGP
jgi:hypothetical protein